MSLQLQPGDIVCTTYSIEADEGGPNWFQWILSAGIRQVQAFNDIDGKAKYTHTFGITTTNGSTFEALWTYRSQNIYEAYAGQPVLIGRHREMTPYKANSMIQAMKRKYEGRRYPALKLPMFLFAYRLLKFLPGKPVCSELWFWGLGQIGLVDHWKSVTPSYVADAIRRWRDFEIIYQGLMPEGKGG